MIESTALPFGTVAISDPVVAIAPILGSATIWHVWIFAVVETGKVNIIAVSANPVSRQHHFRRHASKKKKREGKVGLALESC